MAGLAREEEESSSFMSSSEAALLFDSVPVDAARATSNFQAVRRDTRLEGVRSAAVTVRVSKASSTSWPHTFSSEVGTFSDNTPAWLRTKKVRLRLSCWG